MSQLDTSGSRESRFDQSVFALGGGPEHLPFEPIVALWSEKRGTRNRPERGDIRPHDMRAYLSSIQLLEVVEGGRDFRFRVVGSDFLKSLGYDVTGQCVSELTDPILRERTLAALRRVVETGKPVRTTGDFLVRARIDYARIEKIFLPLGTQEHVTHVLCQTDRVLRSL
jgi:hypothetical protein